MINLEFVLEKILREYYEENGYVHCKNLIPEELIDKLLKELQNFKNRNSLYYSQSAHNWRLAKNDLDENNLLKSSFENFTDLIWARELSKAGSKILQSQLVLDKLREISGEKEFSMWQNMLFDKSTGTLDHNDSWYLDTNPIGHLIAGWFALENITDEGGSFHVFPGSHKEKISWKNLSHNEFVEWSKDESKKYKIKKFLINKGDVVFWHPLLLHGSSNQKIKGKSRKSLTAHYFPINYLKGGGGLNDKLRNSEYKNKLKIQNRYLRYYSYPISTSKRFRSKLYFSLLGIYKFLITKNLPFMIMNRDFYKKK